MNRLQLQLLLIVSCKADFETKLEQLKMLIYDIDGAQEKQKQDKMCKEDFQKIFKALFKLCSV